MNNNDVEDICNYLQPLAQKHKDGFVLMSLATMRICPEHFKELLYKMIDVLLASIEPTTKEADRL